MSLVQSGAYRKQYDFNAVCLLLANMFGPGDNFNPATCHVIAAIIRKIYEAKKEKRNFIEGWGTGKPTREFLYVEDGAEAILLATEKYNKEEPINIGTGKEISIKELVEKICGLMNFKGEIIWDRTKPDGQLRRCLDVSKAQKEFGFKAKINLEKGLKNTIDWYVKNKEND